MDSGAVLVFISQADLLTGNEVCTPIVDDTVVNNSQLVPIIGGRSALEWSLHEAVQNVNKSYVETFWAAEILSQ